MLVTVIDRSFALKLTIAINTKIDFSFLIKVKMFHSSFFHTNSILDPCFYKNCMLFVISEVGSYFKLYLYIYCSIKFEILQLFLNHSSILSSSVFIQYEIIAIFFIWIHAAKCIKTIFLFFLSIQISCCL